MIGVDFQGTRHYRWRLFEERECRIRAAISTRLGGVSRDHLSSMNLGHAVGDSPANLEENRRRTTNALGVPSLPWRVLNQVHGCRISEADRNRVSEPETADALYLNQRGLIAAVMLADCHPVILYDPEKHRGMICHAGWRGSAAGMAAEAVNHLVANGSRRESILAVAGPGIGPCCYQVGEDVADAFRKDQNCPGTVLSPDGEPGKYRLNLEAVNLHQLRSSGLKEDNIGAAGFCTACRTDEFYSYRNEGGQTGRQNALLTLL